MKKKASNSYFQFKQFKVVQEKSPMKVCTDACILGALAQYDNPSRILDIGSGTGLLSLMMAQKYNCPIDGVDMHFASCEEASFNIQNSPWNNRIFIHCQRIQDFIPGQTYDLIISNPPFFHSHKKSMVSERNYAIHSETLPLSDLIKSVLRLLSPNGLFFILLPPNETSVLSKMMKLAGFHLKCQYDVKNYNESNVFRQVTAYSLFPVNDPITQEIVIKKTLQDYTPEFINLLQPYYLNF